MPAIFPSLLMRLKVHRWYLVFDHNRQSLRVLFLCLLWIFNPEMFVNFPIFSFYFYWSYYWHTWIDILHICMHPVLHSQMFIQRLHHLSTRRQPHLLGFKYPNPGRYSPELILSNGTMNCKLRITGEKQFTGFMYLLGPLIPGPLVQKWGRYSRDMSVSQILKLLFPTATSAFLCLWHK